MAVATEDAPERKELEAFVGAAFRRKHAANVATFMPTLLSFRDAGGQLRGVIGLRSASERPLYLEQYLDQGIETAISTTVGRDVGREQIVEVGNLAGANCRAAVRMIALLPSYLLKQRFEWIAFTATAAIRGILESCGAPLVELARADGARVTSGADRWGRYYESDPRVYAGYLPHSRQIPAFGG